MFFRTVPRLVSVDGMGEVWRERGEVRGGRMGEAPGEEKEGE